MLRIIFVLLLFIGFGWLGSSQVSHENINLASFKTYVDQLNSGQTLDTKGMSLDQFFIQLGVHFFIPNANELKTKSELLTQNILGLCEALKNPSTSTDTTQLEASAKNSWKDTMMTYHKILSAPFGPIYDNDRDIANGIYSWPLMYDCGMHVEMLEIKNSGQFSPKALYTSQGLMAVEFALFNDLTSTTCNNNRRFAKVHDWLKTDQASKKIDLCTLALKSSEIVKSKAQKLNESWALDQGNFTSKMVDGSTFENFKTVLNNLTDAMFYFEVAKDVQLGKPLGLHKDCLSSDKKCPDDIEHKWSQTGLDAIEMQFIGLNQIFNEGGFGQYLTSKGFGNVYTDTITLTSSILGRIQDLKKTGTLNDLVLNMNANECQKTTDTNLLVPVCGLQKQIRQVIILFKSEILPALSLNAPLVFQGDGD